MRNKPHSKAVDATFNKFVGWCEKEDLSAFPVSYKAVAGYCCRYVDENGGSTRSLDNVVSAIRVSCRLRCLKWMSDDDHYKLRSIVNIMKYHDMSVSRQKRPIQLDLLNKIFSKLDLTCSADLYVAVLLAAGHDGLLRTVEILSGRKVSDVSWDTNRSACKIRFSRSKTYLKGEGFDVSFRDYGKYSAVRLLKRWFDMNNLWDKYNHHIFPGKDSRGRLDFGTTMSASVFRRMIKREVQILGLNPTHYSGHSLRAGGATDLFLARVPYYLIKKMGRWKSDSAMIYHRDDEDVEEAVYNAFKARRAD